MNTKEFSESDYLTAEIVKNSPTKRATIISDATSTPVTFDGITRDRLGFEVEIDGKKKSYRPNKDTLKNIQEAAGFESTKWVGKVLNLSVVKYMGKDSVVATIEK